MIRSEELIDELVASLHFHNYLQVTSDVLFVKGPLNVVANDNKKDLIQEYIDDVYIDLFFRTHNFRPINIPEDWHIRKYSEEGVNEVTGGFTLNLNNPYDRYTFIDCVSMSVMSNYSELSKMFPDNNFISDIMVLSRNYGPFWSSFRLEFSSPHFNAFDKYLTYQFGMMHSKYKPLFRAQDILNYSKLYNEELYKYCFDGYTNFGLLQIRKRDIGFKKIRRNHVFGEYTLEDILMIFCLLVDKLKMEEYGFLSTLALYAYDNPDEDSFLKEFGRFEFEHSDAECIKPYIRDRDLFLRFTSPTKSKAVKCSFYGHGYGKIQFFEDTPVSTVCVNNSLPLPYLYNDLYKQ